MKVYRVSYALYNEVSSVKAPEWREARSNLAKFQAIVHLVLERTHLDLSDKVRPEPRLSYHQREESRYLGEDEGALVLSGGIQCTEAKATIGQIWVVKHHNQHLHDPRFQDLVQAFPMMGECGANGLNGEASTDYLIVL